MKWKRIKCFLTGGHRLYDKNLQTIHDTNGYHFINYCVKCGNEMFTVFMCRKCEHLLYVEEDENFPQKLGKIAAKSCPCCGEQEEGLWRLLGRAEGFEGTVFTEESDEN